MFRGSRLNQSLKKLESVCKGVLVSGVYSLIIGFLLFAATSLVPSIINFIYFLLAIAALMIPLGVIGQILVLAVRAVLEGLGGNAVTLSPLEKISADKASKSYKKKVTTSDT